MPLPWLRRSSWVVLVLSLSAMTVFACGIAGQIPAAVEILEHGRVSRANNLDGVAPEGPGSPATRQSRCDVSGPVRISPQTVGPLSVTAPIRQLLTICHGLQTMREAEEHSYPAVEFHIAGLTVLASQNIEADSVNLDEPADTWEVRGTNGILPRGVPLNSRWALLRRAYGAAVVNLVFDKVGVTFCKFPTMFFDLDADYETVRSIDGNELTRIPPDSKIVRLSITPRGRLAPQGVEPLTRGQAAPRALMWRPVPRSG